MLLNVLYFSFALLILIIVHEYGHFLIARLCGVKVLRFSFGFGKILARYVDKKGTEYAWSLVPLGGYVKMLDEGEEKVPEEERHLAFNNKPLWARMAIIVAGPIFNFLFAYVALWMVLIIGMQSLAPMVEEVKPGSLAAHAGFHAKEEIFSLNDKPIRSWRDFQFALMPLLGSDETVVVQVKSMLTDTVKTVSLPLAHWQLNGKKPDLLASLGFVPFIPKVPPVVGEVLMGSPASLAGLQVNDRIKLVDDKPLLDWLDLVEVVKKNPGKQFNLLVERGKQNIAIPIVAESKLNNGQKEGFLGVRSQKIDWPEQWLRFQRQDPLTASKTAFDQTSELIYATFSFIGRFISGKLALQNISGPVGIAQGAAQSGHNGMASYLSFLALISISLGVLNLLPIPMLDGGHLLYCVIEFVRGRPLSNAVKNTGLYLGMFFLMVLMILALSNDISRLTS